MRNTITKTVSMMLVTVMVLGIAVMPMRAEAAFEVSSTFGANPVTLTIDVLNIVGKMAAEMLDGSNQGKPLPDTIVTFLAYWEVYVTSNVVLLTQQQMSELCQTLKNKGVTVELYRRNDFPEKYMVVRLVSTVVNGVDLAPDGLQFGSFYTYRGMTVACKVDDSSASQNPSNKYTEDDGSEQEKVLIIDPETQELIEVTVTNAVKNAMQEYLATINVNNNTAYNPTTNTYNNYTDMSYNPTTKTYQVNFSDNRSYTYNFYYDYTYITYIGSSAEYREAYKVYYELPDGRSSGDLTVDELKGLSLQFDMVNYDQAASDTLTMALYDFDGNLDNDGFYGQDGVFPLGASIEYLESPEGFGGNLFIDGSNPFRLNLGGFKYSEFENVLFNIEDGFTVQFRIYYNGSPNSGVYLTLNGSGRYYNSSTIQSSTIFTPNTWTSSLTSSFPLLVITNGTFNVPMVQFYPDKKADLFSFGNVAPGVWYDITLCYYRDPSIGFPTFSTSTSTSGRPYDGILYCYVNGALQGTFYTGCNYAGSGSATGYRFPYDNYLLTSDISRSGSVWTLPVFEKYSGVSFLSYTGTDSSPAFQIDNLRIVNTVLYTGVQSFTPSPVPFSPNLVYVLPSVSDLNDNTVAIMSQLPVSGYRVGGIRPTDPTLASGYVYMHIDGEYIDSVQQWNGAYWEEVTARLYTGIRWIPVTAFNVFTLEDMFDIIDPDADGSGDNVDDIYKYYLWWSGEWGSFQQWLQGTMQTLIEAIQASGGGGGGSDAPVVIVPGYNDQTTTSEITTENPDGSTTKTTIVSNAAGLVYSNSVTTYPTDANGNTKTITVYTDSSGVMYQTETIIDRDGNVTVTEPTKATGTLGSILKMITNGVMSIAGTVIEGFVTIVVDGVKFIIESADGLFDGISDLFTGMFGAVTDFTDSVQDYVNPPGINPAVDGDDDEQGDGDGGQTVNIFDAFFQVLPPWLVTGLTLCFTMMIVFPLMNKIHF